MLRERIRKQLNTTGSDRLLIVDKDRFHELFDYVSLLEEEGFRVIPYGDIEGFRAEYERNLREKPGKFAVTLQNDLYVPYDIEKSFDAAEISLDALFPRLHGDTLRKYRHDLELVSLAYEDCFDDLESAKETETFITKQAFARENTSRYTEQEIAALREICENAQNYTGWIDNARRVAKLRYYAAKIGQTLDLDFVEEGFSAFILKDYGRLQGESNTTYPPILPRVLGHIVRDNAEKKALIVMDGMSLADFEALSRTLDDFRYHYACSYALIPTTTSISRQCLLSGKYPIQLADPFTLNNEEKGFHEEMATLGYQKRQVQYARGADVEVGPAVSFLTIILNDIDDIVHGQRQGRVGMTNDMEILGKSRKIQNLITRLMKSGFTVWMTADHGNTFCKGIGNLRKGVAVRTKGNRMIILKDYAGESELIRENTIKYPGWYSDEKYQYFICKTGLSFDNKDEEVMTHGGVSIEEVIVPFIKFLGVNE
ncbi:MAG: PglZ domain-containing protein [Fusobacteriaceae bacterium]|jgi:hypothetical protein|nr:PglZ domain-containing protein [Fusobacteriaceae bacterium]